MQKNNATDNIMLVTSADLCWLQKPMNRTEQNLSKESAEILSACQGVGTTSSKQPTALSFQIGQGWNLARLRT